MALVGHISGSNQSNSVIGISGSVIIASKPNATFPSLDSGINFLVDEASLFKSTLVSSGSVTVKGSSGSPTCSVAATSGDTVVGGTLNVVGATTLASIGVTGNTTVGGNLTVTGDLTVNGAMNTINTTNLEVKDSVIGLGFASGTIAQTAGDRGWIGGISGANNVMSKWDNTNSEFAFARTSSSATGSFGIASYSNLHANNIQGNIVSASLGFSGSLTTLMDGTSYLIAGTNITITSASNGSVTINSTAGGGGTPGGASTQVQFNDGGSFGGSEGLTFVKATQALSANSLSVTGSTGLAVSAAATISGLANLNGGIAVDSTAFTVADTTGNVSTAGTLLVAQSITGSSTLTLSGQALLNGGISCDAGAFTVADTTGNVSTAGTLQVAGLASLNGGIAVDSTAFTVADTTGNVSTAGTLLVAQSITGSSTLTIGGQAIFNGDVDLGNAITDTVSFTARVDTSVLPLVDNAVDLGSATQRWANVYTGDLHLKNDRGDYTLIEEEDMLTIRFNKTGKRYRFLLEAVPELDESPVLKF